MPRPSVTSVLAGLALAVALAGVAQGAIPGSDGRIRGCYDADPAGAGGVLKDLYVVDERDGCPAGTRELLWNQTGVAGPAGPAGATGAQGRPEDPHASYRTDVRFVQDEGTPDYRKGGWVRVDCNPDETAIGGGAARYFLAIRTDRIPPLDGPGAARNVAAHELGHTLGLTHNGDAGMLMCASCDMSRPAPGESPFLTLSPDDRAKLLALHPRLP